MRGVLVEAAWSASRAPGPLRAFYQRVNARRGFQKAMVATARKVTVLAWHLVTATMRTGSGDSASDERRTRTMPSPDPAW